MHAKTIINFILTIIKAIIIVGGVGLITREITKHFKNSEGKHLHNAFGLLLKTFGILLGLTVIEFIIAFNF